MIVEENNSYLNNDKYSTINIHIHHIQSNIKFSHQSKRVKISITLVIIICFSLGFI